MFIEPIEPTRLEAVVAKQRRDGLTGGEKEKKSRATPEIPVAYPERS